MIMELKYLELPLLKFS